MRVAVIFSLACGAVLDVGMCRYAGKGQSELALLRKMWSIFRPGSIVLADRLMCSWFEFVMLQQQEVDSVCRFTSHRTAAARMRTSPTRMPGVRRWMRRGTWRACCCRIGGFDSVSPGAHW